MTVAVANNIIDSDVSQLSSVFLVVKPSKIVFLIQNTILQKEDRILLYIGYHSIPVGGTIEGLEIFLPADACEHLSHCLDA